MSQVVEMTQRKKLQVQVSTETKYDRYPMIFNAAKRYLEAIHIDFPHILSYGCSTGEEALCLAKKYFPTGYVVGLDVDEAALAAANKKNTIPERVAYDISSDATLQSYGPYNIVFAMSVLCRWPDTVSVENIGPIFPFEHFESRVTALDQNLKTGGLLVIYNSNFNFLDTAVSAKYDVVLSKHIASNGFVRRFDRFNRLIYRGGSASDCIYQKRQETHSLSRSGYLEIKNDEGEILGAIPR